MLLGLWAVKIYPCSNFHHLSQTTELCIEIFVLLGFAVHFPHNIDASEFQSSDY